MRDFWAIAARMLRWRTRLAGALLCAALSAGGLGVGLLGFVPVLSNILPGGPGAGTGGHDLPELARRLNERLPGWAPAVPAEVIDALPRGPYAAVLWMLGGLGVLTILGATANFLHAWLSLTIVGRTIASVREDAFRRTLHRPLRAVLAGGTADPLSRITYDSAALATGLTALLGRAVAQITKGLAALGAAFVVDWRLSGVAALAAPALAVVLRTTGKKIRRAARAGLASQAQLTRAAGEALAGLRLVKAYSGEDAEAARFGRLSGEVLRAELRARSARALASPVVETLAVFCLGFLALVAAKAIIDRQLDPREFLVALASLAIAGASLKPLTGILSDIQQAAAAAARLGELLEALPEDGHDPRLPALPRHSASIVFEGVTLTYPGAGEPALRGVTLRIAHGSTVAVVGPNGSGKTTLLSLLPRLLDPDEGRVLVDGHDVRGVSLRSLRGQIGLVAQETVLFHGTIRENIAYGLAGATDADVREAARRARAEAFILARAGGYDGPVGEHGAGLSGGQRQRLAIARALVRDPAILILDEATSMIDADSEARIAEAIEEFVGAGARTCLVIAHRLSTVRRADSIVVMDGGLVVDQGRHDELLARCAIYRLLASRQLVQANEALEPPAPVPSA